MARVFPYYCISCPCSDPSSQGWQAKHTPSDVTAEEQDDQDTERPFDPRNARSKFSLFPPEHLLYCEECHDIKCPRCVTEEIVSTYCPSCLFEVPSSSIKPDYNRCSRNCFSCPICASQLITTSIGGKSEGPWILSCNYCLWSTLDIGIEFDKPQGLRQQIDRRANGGKDKPSYREPSTVISGIRNFLAKQSEYKSVDSRSLIPLEREKAPITDDDLVSDSYARFEALKAFYKEQLSSANQFSGGGSSGLDAYSSPSSLSRIMNLYTNGSGSPQKKVKQHSSSIREASTITEGLLLGQNGTRQSTLGSHDYNSSPSPQQLLSQYPMPVGNPQAKHITELRPMPTLLRTKRSKRCAACKHILVKPEFKVNSTRYRIKLVALNYIPFITLKPVPVSGGLQAPGPDGMDVILEPGKPSQWIMTLRNPLFEDLNVSLGSPSTTPGKHGHRVTILCPEFTVGKSGDVWDDALNTNNSKELAGMGGGGVGGLGSKGEQIAGKIYDRGRNWTSIVIEVVPKHILKTSQADNNHQEIEEDEDLIEIPIRVRLGWTAADDQETTQGAVTERIRNRGDVAAAAAASTQLPPLASSDNKNIDIGDGKRELSYWMVIGIGRVKC